MLCVCQPGWPHEYSSCITLNPNPNPNQACYASLMGVQVRSPTNDGWAGAVEWSADGGSTYSAFMCTSGCSSGLR